MKGTVRASTLDRYKYAIRPHIKPALGRIKLKSLTPAHVRGFYREKLDAGLASATVHKIHAVLHKALDQAVADGLIPRNAADALKLPRIDRARVASTPYRFTRVAARLLHTTRRMPRASSGRFHNHNDAKYAPLLTTSTQA